MPRNIVNPVPPGRQSSEWLAAAAGDRAGHRPRERLRDPGGGGAGPEHVPQGRHSGGLGGPGSRQAQARNGNRMLKTTWAECALAASRTHNTQCQSCHAAMKARRGYKRATIVTAHKLLRVIRTLLRRDEPYRDPDVDYERLPVERNAPRWLRKLKKYGFLEGRPSRYAAPAS